MSRENKLHRDIVFQTHEGLGSPGKRLTWQWGDIISLSRGTHARGDLGLRKELAKGFQGATRHGVTGQRPAGAVALPRCLPPQGHCGRSPSPPALAGN